MSSKQLQARAIAVRQLVTSLPPPLRSCGRRISDNNIIKNSIIKVFNQKKEDEKEGLRLPNPRASEKVVSRKEESDANDLNSCNFDDQDITEEKQIIGIFID